MLNGVSVLCCKRLLMIEAQIMHSISGGQALFWRLPKHSNTQPLIWIVMQLKGAAATFHSAMSLFPLFLLHLVSCVLGVAALRGKSRACCYTCFMSVPNWGFTHGLTGGGLCVCVCTKSSVIYQHSRNVLERGNPAWRDKETADSGTICFYGLGRSTLTLCAPHTHELDHHTPVKS